LIIGAGPAGVSTALHLLQIDPGWAERMLVVEKEAHPRHKLCGGGVTRLGLNFLSGLGLSLPLPIPQARVDDVHLIYYDRVVRVHGCPEIVIFHRQELDAYLAGEAKRRGVQLVENEAVRSIEFDSRRVTVFSDSRCYHCQAVVGADGSKGLTRQLFRRQDRRPRTARLLETVVPGAERDLKFTGRRALFYFSPVRQGLQGYFWDFPSRQGGEAVYNRGVYDARIALKRPKADLPGILDAELQHLESSTQEHQIEGHPIHWFSPRNRFSLPRLLLVGDAAGADPLFGEGIAPALGYGRVAAEAIQAAYDRRDYSFQDYRQRLRHSTVGRYLMLRWAIAWWGYRLSGYPWFMHSTWTIGDLLTRILPASPALY